MKKEIKDVNVMNILDEMVYDKEELIYQLICNSKKELEGYFSYEEEMLISAVFNGYAYNPYFDNKTILQIEVKDAIDLDGYDRMYNVDRSIILNKIDNLSDFQSFAVIFLAKLVFKEENTNFNGWFY